MLILENSTPCLFLKWDSVECSVNLSSVNRIRWITEFITRRWVQWRKSHENKKLFTRERREIENSSWPSTTSYQRNALFEHHRGGKAKNSTFCLLTSHLNIWFLLDTHDRGMSGVEKSKEKKTLTTNSINKLRNNNNQWLQLIQSRQNWSDTNSEISRARCLKLHFERRKKFLNLPAFFFFIRDVNDRASPTPRLFHRRVCFSPCSMVIRMSKQQSSSLSVYIPTFRYQWRTRQKGLLKSLLEEKNKKSLHWCN